MKPLRWYHDPARDALWPAEAPAPDGSCQPLEHPANALAVAALEREGYRVNRRGTSAYEFANAPRRPCEPIDFSAGQGARRRDVSPPQPPRRLFRAYDGSLWELSDGIQMRRVDERVRPDPIE